MEGSETHVCLLFAAFRFTQGRSSKAPMPLSKEDLSLGNDFLGILLNKGPSDDLKVCLFVLS
jgi:hypothetical protein